MSELRVDNIVSEDGTAAPVYSKGMTVGSGVTFTVAGDVVFNAGATISGIMTVGVVDVTASGFNLAGFSTFKGANFNGGSLLKEKVNITAGKLSDNQDINLDNGMIHLFTTTETTTSTPNITSSTGINTDLAVGDTAAVTIITTSAAAGYSTCVNIDGNYNDVKWLGGSDPTAGSSSGNDMYTIQIIKTASETYTVLGGFNNFA